MPLSLSLTLARGALADGYTMTTTTATATYGRCYVRGEINSPPGTFLTDMRNDWQSHGKYFYGGGHTFSCARAQFVGHYGGSPRRFYALAFFSAHPFT